TVTLSPPTSRASAARSSVVVTTRNGAAAAGRAPIATANAVASASWMSVRKVNRFMIVCPWSLESVSEDVRAVRANSEVELEQELVRADAFRVVGQPVLAANLTEFARPERDEERSAVVDQRCVERTARAIVATAKIPAARELIFGKAVPPE